MLLADNRGREKQVLAVFVERARVKRLTEAVQFSSSASGKRLYFSKLLALGNIAYVREVTARASENVGAGIRLPGTS